MRGALRNTQEPTRNITKQEVKALAELKKDQSRVILRVDKVVAIVIMDKEDYQEKVKALLEDQGTYKALKSDPTSRMKSKLISLLKKIKSEGGIDDTQYKKIRVSHWNKSSEFTLLTFTTFVPRPKKVKTFFSKFSDTVLIPLRPLKFAAI